MGFLDKLIGRFSKVGLSSNKKEEVPLSSLVEWIDTHATKIVASAKLNEELELYKQQLSQKCAIFQSKLKEWEATLPAEQKTIQLVALFSDAHKAMELVQLVHKSSLDEAVHFHALIEPKMDKFIQKIVEAPLTDFVLLRQEQSSTNIPHPFLQQVLELNDLRETFDQKVTQSGFRSMDSLKKRALQLKEYASIVVKLSKDIAYKQERLQLAHLIRQEKETELEKSRKEFALQHTEDTVRQTKVQEAQYRVGHFTKQAEVLQEEIFILQESLHQQEGILKQEHELVQQALGSAVGTEVTLVLGVGTHFNVPAS